MHYFPSNLSDIETDNLCAGLKQPAVMCHHRTKIGLTLRVKPYVRPFIAKSNYFKAIPQGVLNAQIDKGYWPTRKIGNRSLINIEAVRLSALADRAASLLPTTSRTKFEAFLRASVLQRKLATGIGGSVVKRAVEELGLISMVGQ